MNYRRFGETIPSMSVNLDPSTRPIILELSVPLLISTQFPTFLYSGSVVSDFKYAARRVNGHIIPDMG